MKSIVRSALLLAAVATTGCGGSNLFGLTGEIDIGPGDAFLPMTIKVAAGQTIVWTNKDTDQHTVTVDTMAGGPDSPVLDPNKKYTWQVPIVPSGTKFFYHCQFHGTAGNGTDFGTGMVGVVVVK